MDQPLPRVRPTLSSPSFSLLRAVADLDRLAPSLAATTPSRPRSTSSRSRPSSPRAPARARRPSTATRRRAPSRRRPPPRPSAPRATPTSAPSPSSSTRSCTRSPSSTSTRVRPPSPSPSFPARAPGADPDRPTFRRTRAPRRPRPPQGGPRAPARRGRRRPLSRRVDLALARRRPPAVGLVRRQHGAHQAERRPPHGDERRVRQRGRRRRERRRRARRRLAQEGRVRQDPQRPARVRRGVARGPQVGAPLERRPGAGAGAEEGQGQGARASQEPRAELRERDGRPARARRGRGRRRGGDRGGRRGRRRGGEPLARRRGAAACACGLCAQRRRRSEPAAAVEQARHEPHVEQPAHDRGGGPHERCGGRRGVGGLERLGDRHAHHVQAQAREPVHCASSSPPSRAQEELDGRLGPDALRSRSQTLSELKQYVDLNYTGLSKVLKKCVLAVPSPLDRLERVPDSASLPRLAGTTRSPTRRCASTT